MADKDITEQIMAASEEFLLSDFFDGPKCQVCGSDIDYYIQACERDECPGVAVASE